MPRGDGTGPVWGGGPGTGRRSGGKGMGRPGAGPGGNCVCPACGTSVPHQAGTPCSLVS